MQKILKEWTPNELGEFPNVALKAGVSWLVRTIEEGGESSNVVIMEKLNYPNVRLKTNKLTIEELLNHAVEQIKKVYMVSAEEANDTRLTLDVLKRYISELQENTLELELLNKCLTEGIQFIDTKVNILPRISMTLATELINKGLATKHAELVERRKTLHAVLNIKEDVLCHSNTPLVESLSP